MLCYMRMSQGVRVSGCHLLQEVAEGAQRPHADRRGAVVAPPHHPPQQLLPRPPRLPVPSGRRAVGPEPVVPRGGGHDVQAIRAVRNLPYTSCVSDVVR